MFVASLSNANWESFNTPLNPRQRLEFTIKATAAVVASAG